MAKNVYNNALYTLRQQYFADKTIPTYFDLNKLMKDAEKNLLKFRDLITEYNSKHPEVPYREPKAMIIICGTIDMAYTLKSVVKVVSVGCIRN